MKSFLSEELACTLWVLNLMGEEETCGSGI